MDANKPLQIGLADLIRGIAVELEALASLERH